MTRRVSPCCACRQQHHGQCSELPGSHERRLWTGNQTIGSAATPVEMFSTGSTHNKNNTKTAAMVESFGGERPAVWRPGATAATGRETRVKKQSAVSSYTERLEDQPLFLYFLLPLMEGPLSLSVESMPSSLVRTGLQADCTASWGVISEINKYQICQAWHKKKNPPAFSLQHRRGTLISPHIIFINMHRRKSESHVA